jgi:hypothetical protein
LGVVCLSLALLVLDIECTQFFLELLLTLFSLFASSLRLVLLIVDISLQLADLIAELMHPGMVTLAVT